MPKAETEFYRGNGKCKRCILDREKKHYRERVLWAIGLLGGECEHCHLKDAPPEVYDFHHTTPSEKEYSLVKIMRYKLHKLQAELDKVILLCANCHRMEHARLRREENEGN